MALVFWLILHEYLSTMIYLLMLLRYKETYRCGLVREKAFFIPLERYRTTLAVKSV